MSEIDALLKEHRQFSAVAGVAEARPSSPIPGSTTAPTRDPEAFWAGFARELEWIEPWTEVLRWNPPHAQWFVGGKLNVSVELPRSPRAQRRAATRPRSSGKASPATAGR